MKSFKVFACSEFINLTIFFYVYFWYLLYIIFSEMNITYFLHGIFYGVVSQQISLLRKLSSWGSWVGSPYRFWFDFGRVVVDVRSSLSRCPFSFSAFFFSFGSIFVIGLWGGLYALWISSKDNYTYLYPQLKARTNNLKSLAIPLFSFWNINLHSLKNKLTINFYSFCSLFLYHSFVLCLIFFLFNMKWMFQKKVCTSDCN